MAKNSLTDKQQRLIITALRTTGRVVCIIGAAAIAVGIIIAIAQSTSLGSHPQQSGVSTTPLADAIGTWGVGISMLGLLVLALGRWFRNLFEPRCPSCKTRMRIGAHFCTKCGHDVSAL